MDSTKGFFYSSDWSDSDHNDYFVPYSSKSSYSPPLNQVQDRGDISRLDFIVPITVNSAIQSTSSNQGMSGCPSYLINTQTQASSNNINQDVPKQPDNAQVIIEDASRTDAQCGMLCEAAQFQEDLYKLTTDDIKGKNKVSKKYVILIHEKIKHKLNLREMNRDEKRAISKYFINFAPHRKEIIGQLRNEKDLINKIRQEITEAKNNDK